MNTYLNLEEDSLEITKVIKKELSKLKPTISNEDFKKVIIELDEIDNGSSSGLSEVDEHLIADTYNKLYKKCKNQITSLSNDNTMLKRGETISEFMRFLSLINL